MLNYNFISNYSLLCNSSHFQQAEAEAAAKAFNKWYAVAYVLLAVFGLAALLAGWLAYAYGLWRI